VQPSINDCRSVVRDRRSCPNGQSIEARFVNFGMRPSGYTKANGAAIAEAPHCIAKKANNGRLQGQTAFDPVNEIAQRVENRISDDTWIERLQLQHGATRAQSDQAQTRRFLDLCAGLPRLHNRQAGATPDEGSKCLPKGIPEGEKSVEVDRSLGGAGALQDKLDVILAHGHPLLLLARPVAALRSTDDGRLNPRAGVLPRRSTIGA
jgi:hypothetical protein